ncbi:MAG TPA: cation:proton antiporter [Xanthomonadales bacterium]|nr:cation:proton antiporter [Xanthomonadales bacterium]
MPETQSIVFSLFLIFTGAALVATLALYARQALIIGYIVLGIALGPWGLAWVSDTLLIADIAEVGIIFLLFLLGLTLSPKKLALLLKQTSLITLMTSIVFCVAGWLIARFFGFTAMESLLVGVTAMFSSTIIGIKLLPTTVLHHRHTGEVIISVLLFQDLIAIVVMLVLHGLEASGGELISSVALDIGLLFIALPALVIVAWLLEKYVLLQLFQKFDRVQEFVFLLTIAWCLGIAQLAHSIGLSYEIGAFIAGIIVATSPISLFIAESLKPLRDFFLVLFFFALGASLDLDVAQLVIVPALVLGIAMLGIKPVVYRVAIGSVAETPKLAWETGWRLGQMSEFSLLITFLALQSPYIGNEVVFMIQLATLITFIGSSMLVVLNFPTPVAVSDRLRRD